EGGSAMKTSSTFPLRPIAAVALVALSAGCEDIHWTGFGNAAEGTPPGVVFALINFGLLLLLIGWKGGPPIKRMVRQRSKAIDDALKEGAKLRAQAEAKVEEYSSRIAGVEKEVEQLIASVRAAAEEEKRRILDEAAEQAAAMKRAA